jgi:hypothetical protein
MKAVKATGMINDQGLLCLDSPLNIAAQNRVEVIVLVPEGLEATSEPDGDDIDESVDESVDEIKASLRQALHEVQSGQLIPLAQLWDGIETNAD